MPNYQGVWSLSTQMQNVSGWPSPPPSNAFFFQGNASTNVDKVNMNSASNTSDFGDLTTTAVLPSAVCTATRLVVSGPTDTNTTMEYWSTSTGGTGATFGDLLTARYGRMAANNTTRGIFAGGYVGGAKDDIEYITIASTGNATDFGDLTEQKYRGYGTICSATRGIFSSGYTNGTSFSDSNVIEYITIASTGNGTDFGDDTIARHGGAAASNSTRGVIAGGAIGGTGTNVISYITISSTGNATDFGDLSATGQNIGGAANSTKAFFCSNIFGAQIGEMAFPHSMVHLLLTVVYNRENGNAKRYNNRTNVNNTRH